MFAMRGFYARKDTRTPFIITTLKITVMMIAAWPLSVAFGLGGVVAAFSGAFTLAGVVALVVLGRRVGGIAGPGTLGVLARSGVAAAAMLAVAVAMPQGLVGDGDLEAMADIVIVGGTSGLVYLAVLAATRSPDLSWIVSRVRNRA